jgi:cell division septation protein DedD
MGKDTKYLTLAAIVLMTIATLIVITSTKRKGAPATADATSVPILDSEESQNPSTANAPVKNTDIYADQGNGADPNAVRDAYKVMEGSDSKLVDETPAEKPKAKTINNEPVPAAYEEPSKPKVEKFTEKSVEVKKPKPKIVAPAKEITEDTGPVYIVQTSVLANAAAAQNAQNDLKKKGYKTAGIFHSGNNYLVYAGKFQNKESAQELKKRLDKSKITAFVKELK